MAGHYLCVKLLINHDGMNIHRRKVGWQKRFGERWIANWGAVGEVMNQIWKALSKLEEERATSHVAGL